ncbi:MAG: sugar ABC transporter permease [Clostridiales bacterium]|uniref:carbohydrate ABC transporter permease n=1 Tax=Terrisporobacter sp. TaxID=1965305 RepID=UPI002A455933|nr:sugar ABC transporter permease [Terrisporobacter sp.]MCI7206068.1 sugar ABC transporter permease [Clostridium sp.]MDD5878770.1 sugar ABC transporter permease [Clostridiales bacterium]MDD7756484.1 sugar ABC transporter permease [Clostridiales bacterium]MDY4135546.1 sugar ABC transporter permease [Terrisporobacter sp.]
MQKTLKKYFPIFLFPTVIAFCIAFVIPFITGLYLSFCNFTTVSNAKFVGFENYIKAFSSSQRFGQAFGFTTLFTIISIITVNIIAFTLAYLLTKKIKGTNFFRTVFFMPNLIGGIVLGYTWQSMINAILANYGTTLVANAKYGFIGLIILMNWQMIGYMMIIYIAGLQNVPTELIEASKIDGATKWQTLRHVTIPMVMPSITICLFLTLSNSFKLYDQNLALTAGAPIHKTEMLALNIVNSFYGRSNFEGVGQAKAVMFFIIVACIALSQLYYTRKREVEQ